MGCSRGWDVRDVLTKRFPTYAHGDVLGLPVCVPRPVANPRAKLACFIVMPEISRAVFCLSIQYKSHATL